jgi:hypothetical protein
MANQIKGVSLDKVCLSHFHIEWIRSPYDKPINVGCAAFMFFES